MTTFESPVTYSLDGSVATLTLDDGKANTATEHTLSALNAALDRAESDRAVVLLTGRARMFSAGYDLAMFQQAPEVIVRTMRAGGELVTRMLGFPYPIVAACTGHALAQGAFMLLASDVRIGAAGAFKIGLNEVAIGLTIPHYGVELARCRLSAPWFHHATTTGTLYAPDDARCAGFLDRVVEPSLVLDAAREEAQRLTRIDMNAHLGTKQRVRGPALASMRAGIEQELCDE